jgi:hypothetical protein
MEESHRGCFLKSGNKPSEKQDQLEDLVVSWRSKNRIPGFFRPTDLSLILKKLR